MSSIKPPGAKPDVKGPAQPSSAEEGQRADPSFADALESAQESRRAAAGERAAEAAAPEGVSALTRAFERGELGLEEALDRLVERSVAKVEPHLSAAERAELREVLRGAIESDPTLAELRSRFDIP